MTADSIRWAITSTEAANWFPVTRLSHILDVQLFGLDAGAHHMVSVLIHAVSAVLLLMFLHLATRAFWPSAFVAFLFAVHPLHVESVAWISKRKDALNAFFWFLTLWFYTRYVLLPSRGRYLLGLTAFVLGLMSKPMIVTLPVVLLLLDYWPLRRSTAGSGSGKGKDPVLCVFRDLRNRYLRRSATFRSCVYVDLLSPGLRLQNAAVSYFVYVAKTIWPARLAVFYPYRLDHLAWHAVLSFLAIEAISAAIWRYRASHPYLAAGWGWYLFTLLPVIGLVQGGSQARARTATCTFR